MAVSDCGDNGILVSLQIVPQEMAENCFWIKVKEEKFENPDLFHLSPTLPGVRRDGITGVWYDKGICTFGHFL